MKHTHTQGTHKHFIELCAQTAVHIHMRAHVYVNNHTISIIISSGLCYFLTFKNFESIFEIFFFYYYLSNTLHLLLYYMFERK